MPASHRQYLHVVAAAIVDDSGRVLVARRPDHVHQGGLWEFPGGKLEVGEEPHTGLCRELDEEVGIRVLRSRPLIRVHHDYGDRAVLLDVWRVDGFAGEAHGREGQPVLWVRPEDLPRLDMPAANRPIVSAVRLPDRCAITGPFRDVNELLARVDRVLAQGVRLLQLRAPELSEGRFREVAVQVLERCRSRGARCIVNASPEWALALRADGVHLNARRLAALCERPLPAECLVGASCHDLAELRQAERIGADFAFLSPVRATASHPGAPALGWGGFRELADQVAVPVYALGGVGPDDLPDAFTAGAQGVAGIRAWWEEHP